MFDDRDSSFIKIINEVPSGFSVNIIVNDISLPLSCSAFAIPFHHRNYKGRLFDVDFRRIEDR